MNTGAILNRINFGLSLAAGQVPAARLDELARLRVAAAASHATAGGRRDQVDARRTGVDRDAAGPDERRESDVGEDRDDAMRDGRSSTMRR